MRILVLSFYFRPDLSAGSFRATALVRELCGHKDVEIDVVTTLPNRYASFSNEAKEFEHHENVSVRRIQTPDHKSDVIGQSRAFLSYARRSLRFTRDRDYDVVFATSSRLLTAALGAWVSRRAEVPLYLDIRDIFVDTIGDVMAKPIALIAAPVFSVVERWTIRRASIVNLVSRGFEPYFRNRYPDLHCAWYTNGIDDEFIEADSSTSLPSSPNRLTTILYAGNIGEGQCLHDIVPGLAAALRGKARFVIVGDGGRRKQLEGELRRFETENVEILAPVCRKDLIEHYINSDVLFLHLGDYDAFKKVLPSKLFEYGAMGKPVLAGVSGFAAQFVRDEISNSAVFAPGDAKGALVAFDELEIKSEARPEFVRKYARKRISSAMASDIVDLGNGATS